MSTVKSYDHIKDYVTGKDVPNIGAEENRQQVERLLVHEKGYLREDIEVDAVLAFDIDGEPFRSHVDLVVCVKGRRVMLFRCVAGSLGSRHRETLAAARLLDAYQIPYAIVTDGKTAEVLDTLDGQVIAEGMDAIPSKQEVEKRLETQEFTAYPASKIERERIIYRSYDEMNVNVQRKIEP